MIVAAASGSVGETIALWTRTTSHDRLRNERVRGPGDRAHRREHQPTVLSVSARRVKRL
jgi:hypothetical protein